MRFVVIRIIAMVLTAGLFLAACDSPEERLANHYADGQKLLEAEENAKASIEFRNALQIDPDHIPSLYGLSVIQEREGNFRGVSNLLRKILDLNPNHLDANLRFGRILLLAKQLDQALEHSNAALEIDPNSSSAHSFHAGVLLALEDTAGAVASAKRAIELDSANVEAISVLASERISAGAVEEAIALLDQGLEENENNVTLQLIKIGALAQLKRTDEIESILKKLIEFYPDTVSFNNALVRFYVGEDRYDDAERELRRIADNDPGNVQAQIAVVQFLNQYKDQDAAEAELKSLIQNKPDNAHEYKMALAVFYLTGKNDTDKAIATLKEAAAEATDAKDKAAANNQLALLLLNQGNTEEAGKLISSVLEADKNNNGALVLRARIRISKNQTDDAIIDLRTVLKDDPDNVQALVLLGNAHNAVGSTRLAEENYTLAFQASNGSPAVGLPLAEFLMRKGDAERAEDILVNILQRNNNDIDTYRALGQVRIARQDWIGAEEVAKALRRLEDNEAIVSQIEGAALEGLDRIDESIAAFERAQSAAPNALRPMVSLVSSYLRSGEYERAENFLKSVLHSSENNLVAQVELARVYAVSERWDESEQMLNKAIETNPDQSYAYASMFAFLSERNRMEEAQSIVDKGLEMIPNDPTLALLKGQVLEQNQDYEGVLDHFEAMYEVNKNSPVFINNYVSMLTEMRPDRETAERALEIAKVLEQSNVPQFKDTLGWIYYRLARYEEAVPLLEEAASGVPNLAVVRYHLGMAYKALNRPAAAMQELERAVELAETQPLANLEEAKLALDEVKSAIGNQ